MEVKNRSLASISKWSLGRCRGKLKGYDKRIEEIRAAIKIADSLGYLTDDFFYDLMQIGIDLVRQRLKVSYRVSLLTHPDKTELRTDQYFDYAGDYDMYLLHSGFDDSFHYYHKYRTIVNKRRLDAVNTDKP